MYLGYNMHKWMGNNSTDNTFLLVALLQIVALLGIDEVERLSSIECNRKLGFKARM